MNLAICIPSTGEMPVQCAVDLATLTTSVFIDPVPGLEGFGIMHRCSANLAESRNTLVDDAIEKGHTHILWLDDDIGYPPHLLKKLASHNKPIIGCNYYKRQYPLEPTGSDMEFNHLEMGEGLEEVSVLGLGAILMDVEVFKQIEYPYFYFAHDPNNRRLIGEDMFFFAKCREKGIPTYVDHDLSKQLKHYGMHAYG
jgi:hypothetical protein